MRTRTLRAVSIETATRHKQKANVIKAQQHSKETKRRTDKRFTTDQVVLLLFSSAQQLSAASFLTWRSSHVSLSRRSFLLPGRDRGSFFFSSFFFFFDKCCALHKRPAQLSPTAAAAGLTNQEADAGDDRTDCFTVRSDSASSAGGWGMSPKWWQRLLAHEKTSS